MREKILLAGETNTSKTMSLVQLSMLYPDKKVVILDPDDGVEKVVEELGFENYMSLTPQIAEALGWQLSRDNMMPLTIIPVTPNWELMMRTYNMVKEQLGAGDWFCMDMMNRFWDFAQNYFSRMVLGKTPSENLIALQKEAQKVSFGGFDGLTHWATIKRMHNEELVDDALLWSPFNVMATTSVGTYLPMEKMPAKTTLESLIATEFGIKIEGEKHNLYRFDTIAVMQRKMQGDRLSFTFRLAKDKGRVINPREVFDFTGSSFWSKYCEYRGREL